MVPLPAPTDLILVAILPSPRDLEIARLLGWYRIPLRKAPKVIDVDYLAFYQTSTFGETDRWQVKYVAPVRGHELTTRADLLRDEPNHPRAGEEYYKIQVGPLIPLPKPIKAGRWRRLTFIYTTGEYLEAADALTDLIIRSEERDVLWSALRERALQNGSYRTDELPELALDPAILAFFGQLATKRPVKGPK